MVGGGRQGFRLKKQTILGALSAILTAQIELISRPTWNEDCFKDFESKIKEFSMKNIVMTLFVLSVSVAAMAKGEKSLVDECLDKATNNMAMKQCVFEEYARQDKKLNAEYQI